MVSGPTALFPIYVIVHNGGVPHELFHSNVIKNKSIIPNTCQRIHFKQHEVFHLPLCVNVCVYGCVCVYMQCGRKMPKSGGGGGGGGTQTRDLSTFGKELYLDIWLFTNSHLCQFIEIVHNIINWYMKNAK